MKEGVAVCFSQWRVRRRVRRLRSHVLVAEDVDIAAARRAVGKGGRKVGEGGVRGLAFGLGVNVDDEVVLRLPERLDDPRRLPKRTRAKKKKM